MREGESKGEREEGTARRRSRRRLRSACGVEGGKYFVCSSNYFTAQLLNEDLFDVCDPLITDS
jgi:hypothetical protein